MWSSWLSAIDWQVCIKRETGAGQRSGVECGGVGCDRAGSSGGCITGKGDGWSLGL